MMEKQVIKKMQALITQWEAAGDGRSVFLRCYMMMTNNMFQSIHNQEFNDPLWIDILIQEFAEYYFSALQVFENDKKASPSVWKIAHDAAMDPEINAMRKLMAGVNAHINYDLVLVLDKLLSEEWPKNSPGQCHNRYVDYCHVNEVIGRTIDSVQDEILEPEMPVMEVFDKLLGPIDEFLISKLITYWRETVWQNAMTLIKISNSEGRIDFIKRFESEAIKTGKFIFH